MVFASPINQLFDSRTSRKRFKSDDFEGWAGWLPWSPFGAVFGGYHCVWGPLAGAGWLAGWLAGSLARWLAGPLEAHLADLGQKTTILNKVSITKVEEKIV